MSCIARVRGIRWVRSSILGGAAVACLTAPDAASQSATVKLPVYDQRIDQSSPSTDGGAEPNFGYTMVIGDVDVTSLDAVDDLVSASIQKDIGQTIDAGTAFAFAGPDLAPHTFHTLLPATVQTLENFGRLTMDLADVVGLVSDADDKVPLLFVPAPGRKLDLNCTGTPSLIDVGAVDVFDLSSSATAIMTITPPPIPGESPALPCNVRYFGHWVTHGDIDGDDYDDLIVGAPNSDDYAGRVYIFFGHEDFLSPTGPGYAERWMILRPPPSPGTGEPFVDDRHFGGCVSAADLDGDGKAELLVGSIEKAIRGGSEHGPGRAFLFHGYWLASQLYGEETFADVTPPEPTESPDYPYLGDINLGVGGVYETLTDPRPAPFSRVAGQWFGWILDIKCGDLGEPAEPAPWQPAFDERPDILIHSETALGYGADDQTIVTAGALFVFMNNSVPYSGETLVDEATPVVLMTPRINDAQEQPLYYPQSATRFGRGFAVAEWQKLDGSPTKILVVGEPDRQIKHPVTTQNIALAGAVYAFEAPLDPRFDANDLEADHINAWGDYVLLEPAETLTQNSEEDLTTASHLDPRDGSLLGAWIVSGRYDTDFPGDQIVFSARGRDVRTGSTTYPGLGRVYAVTLPTD